MSASSTKAAPRPARASGRITRRAAGRDMEPFRYRLAGSSALIGYPGGVRVPVQHDARRTRPARGFPTAPCGRSTEEPAPGSADHLVLDVDGAGAERRDGLER